MVSDAGEKWQPPGSVGPVPIELVGIFLLAATLRVYRLTAESLWIDENFMVQMATEYTLAELVFEVPLFEPHPPLYNVFMWCWVAIGEPTALWMRSTSVVFALATIPILYLLARRLFDRSIAGLTILFFAVSPFQIWYAQDARMYALLVLATVSSWYLLLRLRDTVTRWLIVGYVLSGAVLGYTHIYGLFVLLAQAVIVAWWFWNPPERFALTVGQSIGLYGGIGVIISPWLAILASRILIPDPEFEDPAGWLVPPGTLEVVETARIHTLGFTRVRAPYDLLPASPSILVIVMVVPLVAIYAAWLFDELGTNERSVLLLITWTVVPVVVPFVLSWLVQPMYELRYTIVAAPAVLMLFAVGIQRISRRHVRMLLVILVLTTIIYPLPAYYTEPQKDQWEDAADLVGTEAADGDVILIIPGWTTHAFTYYYGDRPGRQVPLFAGNDQPQYDEAVADGERVFLVLSYVDDRGAVIDHAEVANEGPPDEQHEFVKITVYIWE